MTNNRVQNRTLFILTIVFSTFWLIAIGLDYINKHPIYDYAFKYYKFYGLTFGLLIVGVLFSLIEVSKIKLPFKIPINGLFLFFIGSVISYFIIKSNASNVGFRTDSSDYMHYVSLCIKSSFQLILLYAIITACGGLIKDLIYKKTIKTNYLYDLAIGSMLVIFFMFLLSAFKFLNAVSLLILLLIMAAISFRRLIPIFKKIWWERIDLTKFNLLGIASIYIIFVFLLINFVSIQNPYPSGFDSRNHYTNISMLLSQNNGLVGGYAPYNWSIFIAIGLILFEQIELSLSISFSAFILVVLAAYKWGTGKLKFDKNRVLFVLAILTVTPALVNQMFVELKVDFGLLFFQILILSYLTELIPDLQKSLESDINIKSSYSRFLPGLSFIGLLCGFGLGIKMINMFLLFSVLALLWWRRNDKISIVAILLFSISIFLFVGIDDLSGLRKYHFNVEILRLIGAFLFLISLGLCIYWQKEQTIKRIIFSAIFLAFTGVSMAPWIVKNYAETRSLNPKTILLGGNLGPDINMSRMIKNYNKSKNPKQ